jgi:aconitate hydratase
MGVLPLQYLPGENAATHELTGRETFDVGGVSDGLTPREQLTIRVTREDGSTHEFKAIARVDSPVEISYYQNGGILPTVLRRLLGTAAAPVA